jgi:regulator of protease activity HflC (stomatin/prohibitin superfamily)
MNLISTILSYAAALLVLFLFLKLIRIVPEQEAFVIEQFGKYRKTLRSGLHIIVPIVQRVAYRHTLKEEVIDVEPQVCITADNVQVTVDGILYLKVIDPEKASYGIENYRHATAYLAKTTMRSEIGKLELDRTFSERDAINFAIVKAVDEASDPWGIKVTRYEIMDISPADSTLKAMEQQMRAEREKRAEILISEGVKESRINISKGEREGAINLSKGEKQKRINEAEGKARAIQLVAEATAAGITEIAAAISETQGKEAMNLQIVQDYLGSFGSILERAHASLLPLEEAKLRGILETLLPAVRKPPESLESAPGIQRIAGTASGSSGAQGAAGPAGVHASVSKKGGAR